MTTISASDVNKLRQLTGAGMMDCKNALVEAEGDIQKAIDILRKKGQKVASKRADKIAAEGVVLAKTSQDNKYAVILMINCETDFVAKNEEFVNSAYSILNVAAENLPQNKEELLKLKINGTTVEEKLNEMMGKIGEKIVIGDYSYIKGEKSYAYIHPGNRIASIVALSASNDEVGKDLAMQIAAMNPVSIDKDDVPQEILEKEKEIAIEQARNEGKPENMLEKIAMGRINKFYSESTLLNQEFIKDNKKTVRQMIEEIDKNLKVIAFKRLSLS